MTIPRRTSQLTLRFHQAPGDIRSQPDTITELHVHERPARDPLVTECANHLRGVSNHLRATDIVQLCPFINAINWLLRRSRGQKRVRR
jgi:hypothetical protein